MNLKPLSPTKSHDLCMAGRRCSINRCGAIAVCLERRVAVALNMLTRQAFPDKHLKKTNAGEIPFRSDHEPRTCAQNAQNLTLTDLVVVSPSMYETSNHGELTIPGRARTPCQGFGI